MLPLALALSPGQRDRPATTRGPVGWCCLLFRNAGWGLWSRFRILLRADGELQVHDHGACLHAGCDTRAHGSSGCVRQICLEVPQHGLCHHHQILDGRNNQSRSRCAACNHATHNLFGLLSSRLHVQIPLPPSAPYRSRHHLAITPVPCPQELPKKGKRVDREVHQPKDRDSHQ